MRKLKKLAPSSSLRLLSFRGTLQRLSVALITLVMTLTAQTAWAWTGEGTEASPYQISTVADLIQLANDVNSGTTYEGFFFELMNNIDFNDDASLKPTKVWDDDTSTEQNFPGIGGRNTDDRTFNGTFDGNNKTISGIRIYSGGTDNTDKQKGLFGRIGSKGTVKNLTLSNARITGYTYTGGIAGKNFGKIENCHVTNTVCIHTFISGVNDYHGGVAGQNANTTGIITNCTSSAKLTVNESVTAGSSYGGIVGLNTTSGTLSNNFVSGATIPAAKDNYHGAIAGWNKATMTNNYYTGCTVAGTENASNVGCKGADVTTDNGAIGIRVLALGTNVTASGSTKEYNSTTYYYGTVTLGYSGTVPTGGIVKYAVNGDYISGNEFTISGDANVTAVVVYPYADISGLTYHGSTFDILGNTYFTSGSYYEINDEQDLIDLANYVYAGNNCAGLTFKMTADLDFTNMPKDLGNGKGNFLPIGFGGKSFYGHFDGQNHSITGLYFNGASPLVGLFCIINNSGIAVENVTLVNPNITAGTPVGGIVASMNAGTISNCAIVGGSITADFQVGGIVGEAKNTTVSGCSVIGTSITAGNPVGIIAGPNKGGLTISNCNYYNIANGLSICGSSNPYTDGGGNQQVYQVTLGEGITAASPAFAYSNKAYYAENATVTLDTNRTGYVANGYQSNDVTISNGSFTMPASDVSVNANWADPNDISVNAAVDEYTIKTAAGWGVFCDLLTNNAKGFFTGKTVKLNDNIGTAQNPVTRMAGSSSKPFTGTFNGQGNTLTVNYTGTSYVAPFSYVDGATIKNLVVEGTINSSGTRAAGVIGETGSPGNGGTSTSHITNCVSSSTISGGNYTGGFSIGGNVEIEGCVFNGKINGSGCRAGFVGYSQSTLKITNCLFAPQIGSSISEGTFYYKGAADITPVNSYYTQKLGTAQGKQAYEVSAAPERLCNGTGEGIVKTYSNNGLNYGLGFDNKYYLGIIPLSDSETEGVTYLTTNLQGKEVTVEFERSFTAGKASTICLPFAMNTISGGKVYRFAGITHDSTDGWVATMSDATPDGNKVTSTEANKPYVFMPDATGEVTFSGVTDEIPASLTAGSTASGDWTFKGTYTKLIYGTAPFAGYVYGFASKAKDVSGEGHVEAGQFVHAKDGASVPPMRCYLTYKSGSQFAGTRGMTRADEDLPQTITVRFVNSRGEVTAIGTLNTQTGEITTDGWYTLNGTRLNGKPSKRGIYINNGRKIVIK